MHYLWVGPVQMVVVTALMYQVVSKRLNRTMNSFVIILIDVKIGPSAFAGVVILILFLPLQRELFN